MSHVKKECYIECAKVMLDNYFKNNTFFSLEQPDAIRLRLESIYSHYHIHLVLIKFYILVLIVMHYVKNIYIYISLLKFVNVYTYLYYKVKIGNVNTRGKRMREKAASSEESRILLNIKYIPKISIFFLIIAKTRARRDERTGMCDFLNARYDLLYNHIDLPREFIAETRGLLLPRER